ncbi:MAG: hypothetical protein QOG28_1364 [Trebonia sp.]|nr:hypothetical protein [Trebonia sp.]
MTGGLFGFVTARRQSAGHFPAMTRGHGRGRRAAPQGTGSPQGTGPATGRQAGSSAVSHPARRQRRMPTYLQAGPRA